ncbi:hypothetical protein LAV79_15265 [Peribacillus butanolivorans]|uniref:hypothetical protein n=1 Tax=Peribacillus butanolivorans TaxID=421767 RepID=UPI0030C97939
MDEKKKPFEYKIMSGNTTIIIHSDLMKLTEEERAQRHKDELAKGDPVLLSIGKAMYDCYRKFDKGDET